MLASTPRNNFSTPVAVGGINTNVPTVLRSGRQLPPPSLAVAPAARISGLFTPIRSSIQVSSTRKTRGKCTTGSWKYKFGGKTISMPINPKSKSSAVAYLHWANKMQLKLSKPDSPYNFHLDEGRVKQIAMELYLSKGSNSFWNKETMIRFLPLVGEKFAEGYRGSALDDLIDEIYHYQKSAFFSVRGKSVGRAIPRSTFFEYSRALIGYIGQQLEIEPLTESGMKCVSHEYATSLFLSCNTHNEFPEFFEYVPKP